MQSPVSSSATLGGRFDRLDALRGFALVWMAVFHFCFDLSTFRFIDANFYADPLWTTQRTMILSLFLLCAGAGQAIAVQQGQSWSRFWRRWGQIVGCAVLVSAGSALMFPRSWISFGVLHGMARRAQRAGALLMAYLALQGLTMLLVEALRGDSLLLPGGIRAAQVVGLALLLVAIAGFRRIAMHAPADANPA